jgi:hypothetical protein
VNTEKTKVMWATMRQYVCGVVVNSKTNMIKRERYKLKAIVHNFIKNGLQAEAVKSNVEGGEFSSHIQGRLNWLKQLNPSLGDRHMIKLSNYLAKYRAENPAVTTGTTAPTTAEFAPTQATSVETLIASREAVPISAPW